MEGPSASAAEDSQYSEYVEELIEREKGRKQSDIKQTKHIPNSSPPISRISSVS